MKKNDQQPKLGDLIFIEWSEEQQCFHFEYVKRTLQKNTWAYLSHSYPIYVPVAIAETWEQAEEIKENLAADRRFRENPGIIH